MKPVILEVTPDEEKENILPQIQDIFNALDDNSISIDDALHKMNQIRKQSEMTVKMSQPVGREVFEWQGVFLYLHTMIQMIEDRR